MSASPENSDLIHHALTQLGNDLPPAQATTALAAMVAILARELGDLDRVTHAVAEVRLALKAYGASTQRKGPVFASTFVAEAPCPSQHNSTKEADDE